MKRDRYLRILNCLMVVFAFCVMGLNIKQFNNGIVTHKIENDRINVYAGNLEDNNPRQGFSINDMNGAWGQTQNINIFNSEYIFPGDTGEYKFLVNNNTEEEARYSINFTVVNNLGAHIKYKLKKNDHYITGDDRDEWYSWAEANELYVSEDTLDSDTSDLITIIWKWIPSEDTDTVVGRNATGNGDFSITATVHATATEIYYYVPPVEDTSSTEPTDDSTSGTNVATGDNIRYYTILAILSGIAIVLLSIRKKQKVKNESTQNN